MSVKKKSLTIKNKYDVTLAETLTGHWYEVLKGKKKLGYFPSSTTILKAYPMAQQLKNWLADQESSAAMEAQLDAAGRRGTRVHDAIEDLLNGKQLRRDDFSLEEWYMIKTFTDWHHKYKPVYLATEFRVFNEEVGYAGTADYPCLIDGKLTIMDWKTSKGIYDSYWLQFASYAEAFELMTGKRVEQVGGLVVGYKRNKDGYFFKTAPRDDKTPGYKLGERTWKYMFDKFLAVKEVWEYDNNLDGGAYEPPILELPDDLKL